MLDNFCKIIFSNPGIPNAISKLVNFSLATPQPFVINAYFGTIVFFKTKYLKLFYKSSQFTFTENNYKKVVLLKIMSDLLKRVLTSLVIIPILFFAITGGYFFLIFVTFIILISYYELSKIIIQKISSGSFQVYF